MIEQEWTKQVLVVNEMDTEWKHATDRIVAMIGELSQ